MSNRKMFALTVACGLLLSVGRAEATELGDLCWLTAKGTLLRFSVTQSGVNHYTYTGLFDDGDGISYALIGEVALVGSNLHGVFTGSKTTPTYFRTGVWDVSFTTSLTGAVTGIRNTYLNGSVVTDYQTTTVTPTTCPP